MKNGSVHIFFMSFACCILARGYNRRTYRSIFTLNCFPLFWRFLPMSVCRKASRKWLATFSNFQILYH